MADISEQLAYHNITQEKIDAAQAAATDVFWSTIAREFHQDVGTGDFGPVNVYEFDSVVRDAIEAWLSGNLATAEEVEGEAVDRFAEYIFHEACQYTIKATNAETAVHLLLVWANGNKAIRSCGVEDDAR